MIIVTGGAGFIGSNIIRGLNERGIEDILVVDNLERADKHRNLNALLVSDFLDKRAFLDQLDRKSTRLNSSHFTQSRMPSSA